MSATLQRALSACAFLLAVSPQADAQADLRPYAPGTPPRGVGATEDRPGRAILPGDQDWSFLDGQVREGSDAVKRIPLGDGIRFSFFGDSYVEAEGFEDGAWGFQAGWDDYFNTRLNLYGELAFGNRARIFAALKHGSRPTSDVPVSPTERDPIDLHQAFIELSFGDAVGGRTNDAFLRIGRQELHYGGGRLISEREGPNVRNDFDGALARWRTGARVTDIFALYEVTDEVGSFDNDTFDNNAVWGLYTSAPLPGRAAGKPHALDLYYFGNRVRDAAFVAASADETRHSIGVRWFSAGGVSGPGLSWDAEATAQFGDHDVGDRDGNISAWSVTASVGYGWDRPWSPLLTVNTGFSSGDDDPDDGDSGTFRASYPPGRYFGDTTPLGPGNLMGASVAVSLSPTDRLTLTPAVIGFWRMEEEDSAYSPGGTVVLASAGDDRFLGWELNFGGAYTISRDWAVSGEVGRFFSNGSYLDDNSPADDITRIKVKLDWKF